MSLTDKLLSVGQSEFVQSSKAEIPSKKLSKKLGEPVSITVRSLPSKRYMEITTLALDNKGGTDYGKSFDMLTVMAAEAVVDPDLKNHELQAHLGVTTPKDAAEKLFNAAELTRIMQTVARLSGFDDGDEVAEVKNS